MCPSVGWGSGKSESCVTRLQRASYSFAAGLSESGTGPRKRPPRAALSGSNPKAPGKAGGYLLQRTSGLFRLMCACP